jgi:hypothetical protein
MVNNADMPILEEFGSSREVGQKLTSMDTNGRIDEKEDYETSKERQDIFVCGRISTWLTNHNRFQIESCHRLVGFLLPLCTRLEIYSVKQLFQFYNSACAAGFCSTLCTMHNFEYI